AFALWMTYGILRSDWALVVPNALCLIMAAFILMMTMFSRRKRERVAEVIESTAGLDQPS
nr:hypothetical protein [Sphingobium sp.]